MKTLQKVWIIQRTYQDPDSWTCLDYEGVAVSEKAARDYCAYKIEKENLTWLKYSSEQRGSSAAEERKVTLIVDDASSLRSSHLEDEGVAFVVSPAIIITETPQ